MQIFHKQFCYGDSSIQGRVALSLLQFTLDIGWRQASTCVQVLQLVSLIGESDCDITWFSIAVSYANGTTAFFFGLSFGCERPAGVILDALLHLVVNICCLTFFWHSLGIVLLWRDFLLVGRNTLTLTNPCNIPTFSCCSPCPLSWWNT